MNAAFQDSSLPKTQAGVVKKLHANHSDQIRETVIDALRWAMTTAKEGNDYASVAAIAIELNSLR